MNRTLISALDGINNLLAIAIILIAALAGYGQMGSMGLIFGLIGGLIGAAIICGLLALLIEIEKNLRQLVALQTAAKQDSAP